MDCRQRLFDPLYPTRQAELVDCNEYQPHESLGGLPLVHFMPPLTLAAIVYQPIASDRGAYAHSMCGSSVVASTVPP